MMLGDVPRLQVHNTVNGLSGGNSQSTKVAILRDDDPLLFDG